MGFLFLAAESISDLHSLRMEQEKGFIIKIHVANRDIESHKTLITGLGLTEPELNSSSKSKAGLLTYNFGGLHSMLASMYLFSVSYLLLPHKYGSLQLS